MADADGNAPRGRYRGTAVDGRLLAELERGNRAAVREFARLAADHVARLAAQSGLAQDDLTPALVGALARIAEGASPDDAFHWRTKQPANEAWLLWSLTGHIRALITDGMTRTAAVECVARAAAMDGKKGGKLWKAFDRYKADVIPDDIFPIPPGALDRLRAIEARLGSGKGEN